MWKQREEPPRSTSVPASSAQAPAVPVQTPSYSAQAQTPSYSTTPSERDQTLSLIHISEPTRRS